MATVPPISTPFLDISQDKDGRIVAANMSPAWQQYFGQVAQFQEAVGMALNLSDIQSALDNAQQSIESTIGSTQSSIEGNLLMDVQSIIDAGASSLFGNDYKGAWVAGPYAVGNVSYYSGFFYECISHRTSGDTDDPATDSTGWSVRSYEVTLTGNVNVDLSSVRTAIQNAIDAQGTASFGSDYKGAWAAGIYAVGAVSYESGAFYTCKVARSATNTDDPATDTASWEIQVAESGGLEAAVQAAIDASAAIQFGSDYTGKWEAGVHVVGAVTYWMGAFYECTQARTSGNTNPPPLDTGAWMLIQSRRQAESDSLGYANFGSDYKGAWVAGVFAVGNVSFYGGRYYECSVVRAATDTNDPATDAASWDVVGSSVKIDLSLIESTLSGLETKVDSTRTDISDAIQVQIDAIGSNSYGAAYDGEWEVGAYSVGRIVYWMGKFYECDSARTSAHTNNPASDTTGWSVRDSSVTLDLSSIETTLSGLETGISASQQAQIDAIGSNAYGNSYKGAWEAGDFAVGNISFHAGMFYKCTALRTSTNTDDPSVDTASWDVADTSATIDLSSIESTLSGLETEVGSTRTDISDARQQQIDAAARIAYGEDYRGVWAAGIFAVGNVVFHSANFYECDSARTSANTSNPTINTTAWSIIQSLKQKIGVSAAVQDAIDASAAIQFGNSYKGVWVAGPYAIGNISFYDDKFYVVKAAPGSNTFPVLKRFSIPTAWGSGESLSTLRARAVSANEDQTFVPPDPITSDAPPPAADNYMLRWRFLVRSSERWNRITLSMPDGCDDWMHVYLMRSTPGGSKTGSEIGSVKQLSYSPGAATVNSDITESDWGAAASDGYYYAMIEAYFGEKSGGQISDWRIGYRAGVAVTPPETVNAAGGLQNIPLTGYQNPAADTSSWDVVDSLRQTARDELGYATFGSDYKGEWVAGVFAVGNVSFYGGRYYKCTVDRTASNTSNPATDASSWDVVGSGINLSSIETSLADVETKVDSTRTDISDAIQVQIDAIGSNSYGAAYDGEWEVGAYSVGRIVYWMGKFYECDSARTSAHTNNPASDTTGWSVRDSSVTLDLSSIETTLSGLETGISASQQAQIDAIGSNAYGNSYKGAWEAGDFAVGNISFHAGMFYKCTALRTSTNTDDPSVDTASWDVADTSATIDLSSIESTLSGLETEVGSTRTDISDARQQQIDAAARIAYGEDYRGVWAAGIFALGDVTFHVDNFYECDAARVATDTGNPVVDSSSWSIIKSLKQGQAETMSGLTKGVQDTIDAQARAIFGTDYRGTWEAGDFAVADVTYWIGKFYRCTVRREPTSTANPATDTSSWELTGTDTQTVIDAAARTVFGGDYTGPWEAGVHVVGAVTYWMGKFYECSMARAATDTNNPATDANGWSIQEGVRSAVKEAIDAGVAAVGAAQFGDDYKGAWAAGNHNIGNIRSFERRYYRCKVARAAANTDDPATDTASWEIIGSAVTILAQQQSAIDAIGASQYGNNYKGKWEAGVHAVGDYRSHDGRYYRCKASRTSGNTSDPASDSTGWDAVGSSFTLEGSLETASQEQIDAAARITYGDDYKGHWSAGIFAVGAVTYDATTKKFYECDTSRNASNTSTPASDTTAWSVIRSLKQDVADSVGLGSTRAQIFTTSGTWIKPSRTGYARVILVGAGGGGGRGMYAAATVGGGGGGGAGGFLIVREIIVDSNVSVTIGAPGIGAGNTTAGTNGGSTTFGDLLEAFGGARGSNGTPSSGGPGGRSTALASPLGAHPDGGDGGGTGVSGSPGEGVIGLGGGGGFGGGRGSTTKGGGGGGGGTAGSGGSGGVGMPDSGDDSTGISALPNSGAGGGGGGAVRYAESTGGNGGSGYAIVFWIE